jgi:transposase
MNNKMQLACQFVFRKLARQLLPHRKESIKRKSIKAKKIRTQSKRKSRSINKPG